MSFTKQITVFMLIFTLMGVLYAGSEVRYLNVNEVISESTYLIEESFIVLEDNHNYTEIEFRLPQTEFISNIISDKEYYRIYHPRAGYLMEEGYPELPVFSTMIAVPGQGEVTLEEVSAMNIKIISDITLYPSQGFDVKINPERGFVKAEEFYRSGTRYPDDSVIVGEPAIMRDFRVVPVTFQPYSYDPVTNELRIKENITIKVRYDSNRSGINELTSDRKLSRSFENTYKSLIANYETSLTRNIEYQQRSMIIIYPNTSNVQFLDLIDQMRDWKRRKGFYVDAVSTLGMSTNSAIKNYIQNAYNNWEHPPEYVLIVGAGTGSFSVPYWTITNDNAPGDHNYTMLEGDDILGDIFIGRLPVLSAMELATIWNKIVGYEIYPYMDNTEWFERPLLVGDPSTASGISPVYTSKYIRDIMLLYNPDYDIVEIYQGGVSVPVNNAINQGVMIYNFRGIEGLGGWQPTESLSNGLMLPNCFFLTCNSMGYNGISRTEKTVTLGTPGTSKGGITAIGMTSLETKTAFNNIIAGGFHYGIFIEGARTMGEVLARGKFHLYNAYANAHYYNMAEFFHWTNLAGDPSMDIWLEVPQPLNVDYPDEVPYGLNFFDVAVTDSAGNPVENAWVTIRKQIGNNELMFASDYTDASGVITLFHDPVYGEVDITVTKPGYIPHLDEFLVTDDGTVSYNSVVYNTDLNAGSISNFVVILRNYTTETVTNVTGIISTESDHIEVINSEVSFADMAPNALGQGLELFTVSVSTSAEDFTPVTFDLDLTDGVNTWYTKFVQYINGSKLEISEINFQSGDNINPGETENLYLALENNGQVDLHGISAELTSLNPYFQIVQDLSYFGDILAGGTAFNQDSLFEVTALSQLLPGMQIPLQLHLFNDQEYESIIDFSIPIGVVTVDDPFGPDEYGYWCYDFGDTGYLDAPVYDWVELNPALGGQGYNLGITADFHNNQQVITVDLPFTFRFYGVDYDLLTICANGWVAFGEVDYATQRNWRLPGPLGPNAMIAAFWDNLSLQNGGVYTYYDEIENYYVIQWDNARNVVNNAEETFQIILYNPVYYPIFQGNGPIKIQYKVFNNVNNGTSFPHGNWGKFATVGIADHTGTVGLEYTFNNEYPTAARELGHETAIYFTGPPVSYEDDYLVLNQIKIFNSNNVDAVYPDDLMKLNLSVMNYGENTSESISGTITSTSEFVDIHNSTSEFTDVQSGLTGMNKDFLTFTVTDNPPANTILPFTLSLTSETGFWEYNFNLSVQQPQIELKSYLINDSEGNNDGVADPGEDVRLIANLFNSSPIQTNNLSVSLQTDNTYLIINDPVFYIDKLLPQRGIQAVFDVSLSPAIPVGSGVQLELIINSDEVSDITKTISMAVGMPPEVLSEDFATWLPSGWTIDAHQGNWSQSMTNNAGGQSPEARLNWSPSFTGISRLISAPINLMGATDVSIIFKHHVNNFSGGYNVGVATRSNFGEWTNIWTVPVSSNIGPETVSVPIDNADLHNPDFQICWFLDGNSYGLNQWYIDDILIEATMGNSAVIVGNVSLDSESFEPAEVIVSTDFFGTHPDQDGNYSLYIMPGEYDILEAYLPYHQSPYYDNLVIEHGDILEGYDFEMNYLIPPEDLSAYYQQGEVLLDWNYPDEVSLSNRASHDSGMRLREQFLHFNVYKRYFTGSFELLSTTPEQGFSAEIATGERCSFYVTAQYNTGESMASEIITINTLDFLVPGGIDAEVVPGEGVFLTWDPPYDILPGRMRSTPFRELTLTGYKVFRDYELIEEILDPASPEYFDELIVDGEYLYFVKAVYCLGESEPSEEILVKLLDTQEIVIPLITRLNNNYPNPFNPETNISFSLAGKSRVSLKIYNIQGRLVKVLVDSELDEGHHIYRWDGVDQNGRKAGSGVYFYRLETDDYIKTKKSLLLK